MTRVRLERRQAAEPSSGVADDPAGFRQRLLEAMTACVGENGYAATTVSDVVRRARTSRRTFYQYFTDKEDCFVAMLSADHRHLIDEISGAVDEDSPWPIQVRQAVEAWVRCSESRREVMLSWLREAPGLGEGARRLQLAFLEDFVVMVQTLCNTDKLVAAGVGPVSRRRAIMLLGGLRELTATTLEDGTPVSDVIEDAVAGSLALLGPVGRRPTRPSHRPGSPTRRK